jgi:hypothetical protein
MESNKGPAQPDEQRPSEPSRTARRRYETPRLVDYGSVGKLTESGGITTKDTSKTKRPCL